MGRLTTRCEEYSIPKATEIGEDCVLSCDELCGHIGGKCDDCAIQKCFDKLAEYEDAEEQGLLLKLPCKVGDTAYYLHRAYLANADKWIHEIDEVEVDSFVLNTNLLVNVSYYIGLEVFRKTLTPYKTLFFTPEEAEQALKGGAV